MTSAHPTRRCARISQAGFTVLEIVVAIAILAGVMAAAGPQMVGSIRASGTAKLVSQAKGVQQGQLDAMRTLPFRVTPSAGDHRDLLDTYYRNRVAPSTAPVCGTSSPGAPLTTWTGFVGAGSTARCSYEQQAGAMYRKVLLGGSGDVPAGFAVVLNTAFVATGTTPSVLEPAANFDSQLASRDRPPSSQVGVTATVLYQDRGRWKPVTVYTQIASRTPSQTRIKLDARATAVQIGSARTTGETISLTGGQLDLGGSLSTTSQARANLSAISSASSVNGRTGPDDSAELSVEAPYTNLINLNVPIGELESGCSGPCWGATLIPPFITAADGGLPRAGVSGLPGLLGPVQTQLPDLLTRDGFQFTTQEPTRADLYPHLVSMEAVPLDGTMLTDAVSGLYNCAFSLTDPLSHLTASGFINSTDEMAPVAPLSVEACGGAHTDVIRILPTTHAPDGLVRITARSAARCRVTGIAHVPSTEVSYLAEIEYWEWIPRSYVEVGGLLVLQLGTGVGSYQSGGVITYNPPSTTDPLGDIPLSTPVSDTAVLGDYIESITGLTADRVTVREDVATAVAEVTIPALVTVQSTPVVEGAEQTAVSVAVGSSYCRAEDNR